ncbi:MAG: GAF domain-containing protein [candidate division NC10 bacterium]|nr:GAF domain-containing protein [candidate division NC10 bacterium]
MSWLRARYSRLSLRQKFALQLAFSIALLFAVLLPSVLVVQERALLAQVRKEGTHLVEILAYSSVQGVVADDFLLLQGAVRSIASRPDIRYAILLNLDGRVRVHSDPRQVGHVLEDAASLEALQVDAPRVQEVVLEDRTRAMDFATPVLVVNRKRAVARLGISLEEPLRGIRRTRNSILLLGGLALLAGVALAFIQGRRVALPMQDLATAARELARGKLARRIPVSSGDELGEVAAAFNKMAESLQALFDTSRQVSSSLHLSEVLQAIVRNARELVRSDAAVIAPYDPDAKVATVAASAGSPTPAFMGLRIVPGQGLGGKVLETGQPFVTSDYLADPRISHPFDEQVRREGVTSAAALPLLHQGEILGILWVVNRRPIPFTEEQIETLGSLASQAAVAVQNARLYGRLQSSLDKLEVVNRQLREFYRLSVTVQAPMPEAARLDLIVQALQEVLQVDRAGVLIPDPGERELRLAAVRDVSGELPGLEGLAIPLSDEGGAFARAYLDRADFFFDRDAPLPVALRLKGPLLRFSAARTRAFAVVPMVVQGRSVGVFALDNKVTGRPVPPESLQTLRLFAQQAAIAIENARLYETLRKAHEELLAAQAERVRSARLAAVGELAAGIAHETRNPLGAISHATETLQRSLDLRGEDAELLEIIRREAARLNEIVSDFLHFGRPRPLALQETDLGALIKDVLLALEQDERCHRAVRFETVLDPALPRLLVDPHHMSQVLWNLYLNAAQAMPGGGLLGTRGARQVGPDGEAWVALEISDTGPGIPSEAEGRLFEPFFTTKPDGTGLGLPIARRIVEEHGGTLTLGPGPAGGTLARIRLPLREARTDATDPGR